MNKAQDGGLFHDTCAPRPAGKVATGELAAELWKRSAQWTAA